jgi:hypothetical protein
MKYREKFPIRLMEIDAKNMEFVIFLCWHSDHAAPLFKTQEDGFLVEESDVQGFKVITS